MSSNEEMKKFYLRLVKENQPKKKDRNAINALRDAELMRVNTELYGKTYADMMMKPVDNMKKIKKLRNKVASTVIPTISNLNPEYPNIVRIKKLRNEVASTVIPTIETPNPNYGSVINKPFNLQEEMEFIKKAKSMSKAFNPPTYYSEQQKLIKSKAYKQNTWLEHVKKCREENPSYTYKQALQKCKETYSKKSKSINL